MNRSTPSTTWLVVTRQSDRDARQRQVYVSVDDEPLGVLTFGGEVTREIPAGRHVLKVHNTLVWKRVEFEARAGEEVRFSLINYQPRGFLSMMAVLGVALLFLAIEREPAATVRTLEPTA